MPWSDPSRDAPVRGPSLRWATLFLVACGGAEPPRWTLPPDDPTALVDDAVLASLQGDWVVRGDQAWHVDGTALTMTSYPDDRDFTIEVLAPCLLGLKAPGSTAFTPFVPDGERRYQGGDGGAFPLDDDNLLACLKSRVVWVRKDGCTGWRHRSGEWRDDPPETCTWTDDALVIDEHTLVREGNVWLAHGLGRMRLAEPHPDFASARAAAGR